MSTHRKQKSVPPRLDRLIDELVDDVLSTPDEVLLHEADAAASARDVGAARAAFERAKVTVGKQKWAAAKAAVRTGRAAPATMVSPHCDINAIRARVEALANENSVMREKLTLAARKGQAWSDETVLEIWQELVELGVVVDDPNS